jgi:hypothetical protein
MGMGCYLTTTIHYHDKIFQSKDELINEIELNNNIINNCEKELMTYMVMTEPSKFWRESEAEVGETPYIWLWNEVQRCIDSIKEYSAQNERLYILLYDWDECHDKNGVAITAPKTDSNGKYFGGDCINTVYPDGTEAYNYRKDLGLS